MSTEIRKETDIWGNEKEVIYDKGTKIGEIKEEQTFFGLGPTVKREYNNSGDLVSEKRNEETFFGLGPTVERTYSSSGDRVSETHREEKFFGLGPTVERTYDSDGNCVAEARYERTFFGLGPRVKKVEHFPHGQGDAAGAEKAARNFATATTSTDRSAAIEERHDRPNKLATFAGGVALFLIAGAMYHLVLAPQEPEQSPPRSAAVRDRPQPRVAPAAPAWASGAKLSIKSFGPVRIGMTLAEANAAVRGSLVWELVNGEDCFFARPYRGPAGLVFMISHGKVSRIEITSTTYSTVRGARVGNTQQQVLNLYAGALEVTPRGEFGKDGNYLTFVPKETADRVYRMIFETNGNQVTRLRAGILPEVAYVGGCPDVARSLRQ